VALVLLHMTQVDRGWIVANSHRMTVAVAEPLTYMRTSHPVVGNGTDDELKTSTALLLA